MGRVKGLLFILFVFFFTRGYGFEEPDTINSDKPNVVKGFVGYFAKANKKEISNKINFNFIGGPHYSSDTKLGLGVVAAGLYRTCPEDTLLPPSNVSLIGDVSTAGYYSIGVQGVHLFPQDRRRINYNVSLYSFKTYFWGIGYAMGKNNENKTRYKDFHINVNADYVWRVARGLFLGPMVGFDFTRGSGMEDKILWEGERLNITNYSAGVALKFDTRDHLTNPYSGWFLNLEQKFYPRFLWNGNYNFSSTQLNTNFYKQVWKGGVIATRFHTLMTYGNTPWGMLARIDGTSLRGYYEGRYRDKCEMDLTVELRQHVYRRSGAVVWVGAGSVFRDFSQIHWRRILPNAGVGYRWEFKQRTNVRIDFGVGRHCSGLVFNINEAF